MSIGHKIKERRQELGLSQRELSKRMGYQSHSTLNKIEAGLVDVSQSRIMQFAEVLHTTVADLMGWEEREKSSEALARLVVRLREDDSFLSAVSKLNELDPEQVASVEHLLNSLLKQGEDKVKK